MRRVDRCPFGSSAHEPQARCREDGKGPIAIFKDDARSARSGEDRLDESEGITLRSVRLRGRTVTQCNGGETKRYTLAVG